MFRFIDDLCARNYHQEFVRNFKNIFPTQLQLKNENISTSEKENKTFKTQLYDKRDAFFFSIVCMSNLDSNIPLDI